MKTGMPCEIRSNPFPYTEGLNNSRGAYQHDDCPVHGLHRILRWVGCKTTTGDLSERDTQKETE